MTAPGRARWSPSARRRWMRCYSALVGGLALGVVALLGSADPTPLLSPSFWLVLVGMAFTELVVASMVRGSTNGTFTSSTVWAYAALLVAGLLAGMLVYALGALVHGLVRRSEPIRVAFNAGQLPLSMVPAGALLAWTTGAPLAAPPPTAVDHLATVVPAILAAFVANQAMLVGAIALLSGLALGRAARQVVTYQKLPVLGMMLASPVVAVVIGGSPQLLPLLLIPCVALFQMVTTLRVREHQAFHDHLTGVANRAAVERDLAGRIEHAATAGGEPVAVIVIDLDGFKAVNDAMGHAAGDEVLRGVATRLREATREGELVARLGGDEFVVVVADEDVERAAGRCAAGIARRLAEPIEIEHGAAEVSASIGVARFPDDGDHAAKLLRVADVRMYRCKRAEPHDHHVGGAGDLLAPPPCPAMALAVG